MKQLFRLSLLLILLPFPAMAELPPHLGDDFTSQSGYVIMPVGQEYLIDLDASKGLREGDILSVIIPGDKVVHPVTQEVLGTLDTVKNFLQVTRVKSGYSYASPLQPSAAIERGDLIRRFDQVPTRFEDELGTGEQLYKELKANLPQLEWLGENSSTPAVLIFQLNGQGLSIKTVNGNPLRSYPLRSAADNTGNPSPQQTLATQPETPTAIPFVAAKVTEPADTASSIIRRDLQTKNGVWTGPNLEGNPVGIAAADFDSDKQQEIAIAMDHKLIVARISGGHFSQLAELSFGVQLLSIDSIDLDGNGVEELYLTAIKDGALSSLVVEYTDGSYQPTIQSLTWFMRKVTLPGKGSVLLGQKLGDGNEIFYGQPFRINRNGNHLQAGTAYPLPNHVDLYGFVPFTDSEGNNLIAYLTESDYLKVVQIEGTELWESPDHLGGSETRLDLNKRDPDDDTAFQFEVKSRLRFNDAGEILVTQNEGARTFRRYREFKDGRLLAFHWDGHALQERWRTAQQNGYLADFLLADADNDGVKELAMVIKFKHKGLLQKARSSLVIYELN